MKPAIPRILTINGGSSSIKFALFEASESLKRILEGIIEKIGQPEATLRVKGGSHTDNFSRAVKAPDHMAAVGVFLDWFEKRNDSDALTAVGHRVVHGGPKYSDPERITVEMIEELKKLSAFDPEHLPEEILLAEAFHRRFPDLPQIACFDTAFHHDLPRVARMLPIPRRYEALGVRRYGFHGLSYEFLIQELERLDGSERAHGRVILAHLGNGASLAAVHGGKSIDTSMGFTPASGLVMSSRSGDLDPGLISFMARREQMTASQFDRMINHESGLIGISETSSDMRELLAHETQNVRAVEAIALFCYQARKWIGAFAAALGGVDTLVFAGGIGENAPVVRTRICDGLQFLGIEIEEKRNVANEAVISTANGRVTVRVIHTDEELMIARSVACMLDLGAADQIEPRNNAIAGKIMRIGIAADHGGFELKEQLTVALKAAGYEVVDFGAHELITGDDYPDFVAPMARAVAKGEVFRGLAICGSGVGACVAANKIPGVRAALITDSFSAHQGVEDDDMNVMCLGGRVTGYALAWDLARTFLRARFKGDRRFNRRLAKVKTLEKEWNS